MQKGNGLRTNHTMNYLEFMLQRSQEVIYRKKIRGIGFTPSIFDDDSSPISRKTFWEKQDYFLNSRLIVKLPSGDKREKPYSLTPFGICYYVMNYQNFDISYSKKIIRILKSFNKQKTKLDDTAWDQIDKLLKTDNSLLRFLDSGIHSVKIYGEEDRKLIRFTYQINTELESIITQFIIEDGIVGCIVNDPHKSSILVEWTDEKFHSEIAEHIMEVFCYNMIMDDDIHGKKGHELIKNIMHDEETIIMEKAIILHEKLNVITDKYLRLHNHRKNQLDRFLS